MYKEKFFCSSDIHRQHTNALVTWEVMRNKNCCCFVVVNNSICFLGEFYAVSSATHIDRDNCIAVLPTGTINTFPHSKSKEKRGPRPD